MPELPEVETIRRELEPWLTRRTIVQARRAQAPPGPKYANLERADGQRIEGVMRRGKFLIMPLSAGDELIVHLGMTGVIAPDPPDQHLRVLLKLSGRRNKVLYFRDARRFGRFLVAPGGDRSLLPSLATMGPEPLNEDGRAAADDFDAPGFYRALQASRQAIKTRLLGQRAVAGVGNIYADEALWRVRIHPSRACARISRKKSDALRLAIIDVLRESLESRGTTLRDYRSVDGGRGAFVQKLAAYGRHGEPCVRCSALLRRIVVGARGTHFCPRCQRP